MGRYDEDLLRAAVRLLGRKAGQPGKLPTARVRRSISTSYYAIFHFLLEDASTRLIGSHNDLRRRRRILARSFTHGGIKTTLKKVKGLVVEPSASEFLRPASSPPGQQVDSPRFAREMALAFLDAKAMREDADYNLNKVLSEADARLLRSRIRRAVKGWRDAKAPADRDFKNSLGVLMLLQGKLRSE
jgi:hypothetical protein